MAAVSWILLTAYNPAVGFGVLMSAVGATAAEMLIGGWFSGWAAVRAGSKFWQGMEAFVQNSVVEAFAINLLLGTLLSIPKAIATKTNMAKCFAAGTLVLTEDGHRKIEDVEVGNLVWAYDEETGESALKEVVQLFRNSTSSWICTEIDVDGETEIIKSTPGHKYYLPKTKEWVSACNLRKDDRVLLSNGKYGKIKSIKTEELDMPETTFNFEVEDFHTYYVGENGVLVHNLSCGEIEKELTRIANKYDDFQCVDAADEMKAFLNKNGVKYRQIEIKFSGQGKYNNIYSDTLGRTISTNGYHTGILYNGKVFDNLFKAGLGYSSWIDDFVGFGTRMIL